MYSKNEEPCANLGGRIEIGDVEDEADVPGGRIVYVWDGVRSLTRSDPLLQFRKLGFVVPYGRHASLRLEFSETYCSYR